MVYLPSDITSGSVHPDILYDDVISLPAYPVDRTNWPASLPIVPPPPPVALVMSQVGHSPPRSRLAVKQGPLLNLVSPKTVLAGTDSLLSQKDTWERMTVMKHGMYVWITK